MAEIVQSLFGVTPEMYQQNRQAQADQQALQYAKLSPFEQANFAIGRGATMLGSAAGRALGGEDPELARVTARQQISRQINYADPASIAKGVEMLSAAGDTQGAMMLADVARKAESEKALALQRTAQANRETRQAVPNDIQIANEIATLTDAQDQLMNQPASPDRDRAINLLTTRLTQLERLTSKADKVETKTEIQKLQEYAASLPADSPLLAQVQAVIKAKSEPKGTTITNVMPGDKALADIPAFRASIQRTIEPQSKAVFAADNALVNIQDSIDTNNFTSFRAAQTQFARAISGSGDLSQKELLAAGADPSLIGGTADYLAKLFTSTPSLDTQEKMKKTLLAIKKVSTDKANAEINAQRQIAYSNPGYDKARVDQALIFPEFSGQSTVTPLGSDYAAQAKAILEQRKKGKK
jgi:hypothetical protein